MGEPAGFAGGQEPLIDPAILRVPVLRAGLTSFFFQIFVQGALASGWARWGAREYHRVIGLG